MPHSHCIGDAHDRLLIKSRALADDLARIAAGEAPTPVGLADVPFLIDDVMARLWRVREKFGDAAFRAAARAATRAVARTVLNEAERRTRAHPRRVRIADFPLSRIIRGPPTTTETPCERSPIESNPDK